MLTYWALCKILPPAGGGSKGWQEPRNSEVDDEMIAYPEKSVDEET
jgi:hypothetical protein